MDAPQSATSASTPFVFRHFHWRLQGRPGSDESCACGCLAGCSGGIGRQSVYRIVVLCQSLYSEVFTLASLAKDCDAQPPCSVCVLPDALMISLGQIFLQPALDWLRACPVFCLHPSPGCPLPIPTARWRIFSGRRLMAWMTTRFHTYKAQLSLPRGLQPSKTLC